MLMVNYKQAELKLTRSGEKGGYVNHYLARGQRLWCDARGGGGSGRRGGREIAVSGCGSCGKTMIVSLDDRHGEWWVLWCCELHEEGFIVRCFAC